MDFCDSNAAIVAAPRRMRANDRAEEAVHCWSLSPPQQGRDVRRRQARRPASGRPRVDVFVGVPPEQEGGGKGSTSRMSFGRIYTQADSWHTDERGYELVADGVLQILKRIDAVARARQHDGELAMPSWAAVAR